MHSFLVIPAKAGTHTLDRSNQSVTLRVWVPAFAGMTQGGNI
jgi:hypothetical protein